MPSTHPIPIIHRSLRRFVIKYYSKAILALIVGMAMELAIALEDTRDKSFFFNFFGHITAIITIFIFVVAIIVKLGLRVTPTDGVGFLSKLRTFNIDVLSENVFINDGSDIIRTSTRQSDDLTQRYRFADSDDLASKSGIINYEAFRNSSWHDNLQDKIARNVNHGRKNGKTLMLIKSNPGHPDPHYIAYTHIIPVSYDTWNRYINGEINDNDFSAEMICDTASSDVYGLIVFSVGNYKQAIEYADSNNDMVKYDVLLIFQALTYHINKLIDQHFSIDGVVYILLQTERRYFKEVCLKNNFRLIDKFSADGHKMFEGKIKLTITNRQ